MKTDKILRGFSRPIFFSGPPSLALAALPDDAVLVFNVRAFSPYGDCATRSHRRRVPRERKKAVQQTFSADLQPVGNLRGAIGLINWRQSRFSEAITADELICTRGDVWRPATGKCERGSGVLPDGLIPSSIVVGIVLFTGGKGGETVFRRRVAVYAGRRAQGQSCRELISCLGPRVA